MADHDGTVARRQGRVRRAGSSGSGSSSATTRGCMARQTRKKASSSIRRYACSMRGRSGGAPSTMSRPSMSAAQPQRRRSATRSPIVSGLLRRIFIAAVRGGVAAAPRQSIVARLSKEFNPSDVPIIDRIGARPSTWTFLLFTLRERLVGLGAEPDASEPVLAGMALEQQPPEVQMSRRDRSRRSRSSPPRELAWEAGGMSEAARESARSRLHQAWDDYQSIDVVLFAAFVGGRPVSCGGISFTPHGGYLAGAGTHLGYRGRGCYRALVRARWDAAQAVGTSRSGATSDTSDSAWAPRAGCFPASPENSGASIQSRPGWSSVMRFARSQ